MHRELLLVCGLLRYAKQPGAGLRMVSDLGILAPLLSALQQLIDENGFLSISNASVCDPVLSYVAYYRRDEVDWSVIDLSDHVLRVGCWECSSAALWGTYLSERTLLGMGYLTCSRALYRLVPAKGLL